MLVLHELHVGKFPVAILQGEEGDVFVDYSFPTPNEEQITRIETYLLSEGFLPPPTTFYPTTIVQYKNGMTETYRSAAVLSKTQDRATILHQGKILHLQNVEKIEYSQSQKYAG